MFTRYAYEEIEVAPDVTVKPGEQIGLLLGMANHDPRAFAEPGAFQPDRADQKNVSFGAGIHFCIGAPLARLELQVGAEGAVRPAAASGARRRAALPRQLAFPRAGEAGGDTQLTVRASQPDHIFLASRFKHFPAFP